MPISSTSDRLGDLPLDPGFRGLVAFGVLLAGGTLAWDALTGARYLAGGAGGSGAFAFHPAYIALLAWLAVGLWTAITRRAAATHTMTGLLFLIYWLLEVIELGVGFAEPPGVTSAVGVWTYARAGPIGFALLLGASSSFFFVAAYGLWHGLAWGRWAAVVASAFTITGFVGGALILEASGQSLGRIGVLNPYWLPIWLATVYLLFRRPLLDR